MSCSQSQGKHKDVTNTPFIKTFRLPTQISILISQICLFGGWLSPPCWDTGKHAKRFPFWRERGTVKPRILFAVGKNVSAILGAV